MSHFASPSFWSCYRALPPHVRDLADKNFALLKANPAHPSLHFKKVGRFRSARIVQLYRSLAVEMEGGFLWFWIGDHAEYERLIRSD